MEVSSLRIFLSVADTGGISAAAEKLHYVQSNVTARIKKLEEELGAALFVRQSRGMSLTAAGRVLRDYAERILRLELQATDAVRGTIENGGSIRLGSMETTMAIRLPAILKELHAQMPSAEITVSTGRTEGLIRDVLEHRLDCAYVGGPVEHPEIESRVAFEEELVLVTSKEAVQQNVLLVFRTGCVYRARAEQWLREEGLLPYSLMEYGTLEGILGCVDAGLGCTLMPKAVVERSAFRVDVDISPIPAHIAMIQTLLIRRRDTPLSGAMRKLDQLTERSTL
ncbi:MAG: LysR family transcriptional regulator [Sedimenticola sp.]|mgnify:CR=1 FL=1|nr:LysR family transcriptional regulator [Sedimenticola sp.]MCW8946392.1 LysR family transcriptional regulator [Sedimenticola sp.]MCW8976406.1 LysR family transcriptional regulator [Sedimenticola sp.]